MYLIGCSILVGLTKQGRTLASIRSQFGSHLNLGGLNNEYERDRKHVGGQEGKCQDQARFPMGSLGVLLYL